MSSIKGNNARFSRSRKVTLLAFVLVLACVWILSSGSKPADAQALSGEETVGMSDEVVINASVEPIAADEKLEVDIAEVPKEMNSSKERAAVRIVKEDAPKHVVAATDKTDKTATATTTTKATNDNSNDVDITKEEDTATWSKAKCSWYGPGFYGKNTASGKKLTKECMYVAHKTLPFGTKVEFRYNGKVVTGVVQDRGPFIKGREFDLGPGVANALGFDGVQTVEYRIL